MSPAQALRAHGCQPVLERRFEQLKAGHEAAPVFRHVEGLQILNGDRVVDVGQPALSELQRQVLELLPAAGRSYRTTA